MTKRPFKSQASSSRVDHITGFSTSGTVFAGSTLSYLSKPPDPSTITDANVVVAFKNLLKKDSTTKVKGLEDLRSYVQSQQYGDDSGVEQPILEAWVRLYPRLSIDNSRRVRELSHVIQYELLRSTRKRMEKYIPNIVGPWLSATFDRDRAVARAANDGITSFLDTEEKLLSFWRRCQSQILVYAQEAFEETPQTLSDERNMSPDDVQATYYRVVGASMSLVTSLLIRLDDNYIQKRQEEYDKFLSGNKTLWGFIASDDAFLRRTSAQLLSVCLDKQSQIIERDLGILSHVFISKGLCSPQSGSSLQFLQTLDKLTQKFPAVWSTAYKGKPPLLIKLRQFVEKGSQGGPSEYWQALTWLFRKLPAGVLPTDLEGATDLLKALRNGINNREEPRTNAPLAWDSYFEIVQQLRTGLSDTNHSEQLLRATVFPVFEQFLRPASDQSSWSVGSGTVALAKAFKLCYISELDQCSNSLHEEWWRLTGLMTTSMLAPLPEQPKDCIKSQTTVIAEAHRWFALHAEIIKSAGLTDSPIFLDQAIKLLKGPCSSVILKAVETITIRIGKPYGAASILEVALRITPKLVGAVPSTIDAIESFLREEFPKLLTSPSSGYLIASIFAFGLLPGQEGPFKEIWETAVHELLAVPDSLQKIKAIHSLISSHSISQMAQQNTQLQGYLLEYISKLVQENLVEWSVFESAITFDILSIETASNVMSLIIHSLSKGNAPLLALEFTARKKPQLLRIEDGTYLTVMTGLLLLAEAPDPGTVSRATAVKHIVEEADTVTSGSDQASSSILQIIKDNLENVSLQSLTIDTLVQQAEALLHSQQGISVLQVLPNPVQWSEALLPLLEGVPSPELSLINSLGSAVSLVRLPSHKQASQQSKHVDLYGFTIPFRMALYTAQLLSKGSNLQNVPADDTVMILRLLSLTFLLANDQCNLKEEDRLWDSLADSEAERQVLEFMGSEQIIQQAICKDANSWRSNVPDGPSAILAHRLVRSLIEASSGTSTVAFYSARALNSIIAALVAAHGWKSLGGDEWLTSLDILRPLTPNVFASVAILSGLQEFLATSKLVSNLCNRLISDITSASANEERTLELLILLNATIAVFEPSNLPIANNRVVFAVKNITSWMTENHSLSPFFAAEACRSLQLLLPSIRGVYGPYWETTINFCVSLWKGWKGESPNGNSNEPLQYLSVLNTSLRLVTLLKSLKEPNDDLSEALTDSARLISNGLLELLRLPRTKDSSPWLIFQTHLWRQSADIPSTHIPDLSVLYPLIASDSSLIQSAAFLMLSRAIPATQEQISIDVVLEKKDARLPEELLSLLLEAPSLENFSDEELAKFPPQIRGYLYAWELVFSSYPKASHKVRNDYNELLKSEDYISPLLDFLFDILGHSQGRPLNLDRAIFSSENIQIYDDLSAQSDGGERNIQRLLVNLYYQCLKFAPGLAKKWWMNCKSKQTRMAVESWTEKYFSPLVIADTLDEVATWAAQQETGSDDEIELIIKVSKSAREVYAECEVDDMRMKIVIRLPAVYPLEGVKVDGINRVVVSEKKWQNWLMITQGVITFSDGSIIDGLIAFRRNVTGALKGQTECAICYSIISSDKRIPDKRCPTCKNPFHSVCLFKWFSTSNQSTCPLCRNPFGFIAGSDSGGRARRRGGPE